MKIPRAVPDRLQGAGEQSQKSKRQWKVGEWSDDIAAYLPDLPYLLQSPPPRVLSLLLLRRLRSYAGKREERRSVYDYGHVWEL